MKTVNTPKRRAFFRLSGAVFLEIRQDSCVKTTCQTKKYLAAGHIACFQTDSRAGDPYRSMKNIYAGRKNVTAEPICTDMENAGMDVRTLQYLMGRSGAGVALNIYPRAASDRAAEQAARLLEVRDAAKPDKLKKPG